MVTQNNDIEVLSIKIKNDFSVANSVSMSVNLPTGIGYYGHSFVTEAGATIASPSRASYIGTTGSGSISGMEPGEIIILKLSVYVTNILAAVSGQFTVTGSVSSSFSETNTIDNTFTKIIGVTTCAPVSGAIDITSCCCGNILDDITPCSHGTTKILLKAGSLVNLSEVVINEETGRYSSSLIVPIANGSFKYQVWCTVGSDDYLTGEGTVTVLKHFSSYPSGGGGGTETYYFGEIVPGTVANTVNLLSIFPVPCESGDPSYSVSYDNTVYTNIVITGDTLTYDVLPSAPVGSYPFIIQRNCI